MQDITFWDRLTLGSICAAVGTVLGAVIAFLAMLVLGKVHAAIVAASAGYFFLVGFIKGVRAGDLAGEAVGAAISAVAAMGDTAIAPKSGAQGGSGSSVALWVGYAACIALAALIFR